jgi:nucleoside-diphosphate-sugar epimerase
LPERKRVLITGAAGRIALMVREALAPDCEVTGLDIRPSEAHPNDGVADMTDLDAIRLLFRGQDVVVDFANNPAGDLSWEDAYHNNILATFNSMRAAHEAGVWRYVYTSSNRATEGYEHDDLYAAICAGRYEGIDAATFLRVNASMPVRPNGPYGIAKAAAEAAGRYFSDQHGMSVICLRLGTMGREGEGPRNQRQFATMLTPRDVKHLYQCAVSAPDDLRFGIFYGVSNNKWNFWDIADARERLGYQPRDNMETWR